MIFKVIVQKKNVTFNLLIIFYTVWKVAKEKKEKENGENNNNPWIFDCNLLPTVFFYETIWQTFFSFFYQSERSKADEILFLFFTYGKNPFQEYFFEVFVLKIAAAQVRGRERKRQNYKRKWEKSSRMR